MSRKWKWHPPPAPSPRILNLPRPRRRLRSAAPPPPEPRRNLRTLLDEEQPPAEIAAVDLTGDSEERWRIQAELLRAECDSLRIERDAALQKAGLKSRKKIDLGSEREFWEQDWRRIGSNFELRRRLENIAASVKEVGDIVDGAEKENNEVDMLRRKMEGLSKGLLEKLEKAGFFLSAGRYRRCNEVGKEGKEKEFKSCCNCKEVVAKITEQVRMETKQWNEMHVILEQVRIEMEDLHSSRDLWHRRFIASGLNLRLLRAQVLDWQQRSVASEHKVSDLEETISHLQSKLQASRARNTDPPRRSKSSQQSSLDSLREKEKHVLVCRLKEHNVKRRPLQEIGNSSMLKSYN